MIVVQNIQAPGTIQSSLRDLMRSDVASIRVCSAYLSIGGSYILSDALLRASSRDDAHVQKTIVCSLDFGITEPEALSFWSARPNCQVLVAGTEGLRRNNLIPRAAFHAKFYLIERPDGSLGSLLGSANLTSRGLTINSEMAWIEHIHPDAPSVNAAWGRAIAPAELLTNEILDAYAELRARAARQPILNELEPVPAPDLGALHTLSNVRRGKPKCLQANVDSIARNAGRSGDVT